MTACERKIAFEKLRPLCVQLTKEHTRKNVGAVQKELENVDRMIVQELQEYLLFPLRVILKQPKHYSEDLYTDVFVCMEKIISHTRLGNWEIFVDLFSTSSIIISSPSEPGKVASRSEELKLAVVQNMKTLLNCCDFSIIQKLFAIQSLPVLGHAVSVLLNLAETEKARNLKVAAMKCLVEISQVDGKYCSKVKAMLGDTFASFLPGISITLCRVITGDSKQGQSVLTTAICTWTKIVKLVMDDKLTEESQNRQKHPSVPIDGKIKSLAIKRDHDWIKTTGSKINVLVKQISKIHNHSNWRVRLALVDAAGTLLQSCLRSLKDSIPDFLEILVGMISDDYPNIASKARKILETFSHNNMGTECRPLVEMLEENLHNIAISLPRQIRSVDEDQKLSSVTLMSGYISLLGTNVNSLLMSVSHLKRLSLSLVQVLELDCSDIKIVEERTRMVGHGASFVSPAHVPDILQPKKHFKHFHDRKIHQELKNVCRLLGYYGNLNLLVDHFMDIFNETILHKMQATLIINEVMMGAAGIGVKSYQDKKAANWKQHTIEELEGIVRMLIDEYLSPSNFHLVTSLSPSDEVKSTPENRLMALTLVSQDSFPSFVNFNRNIVQVCLYLEGIGVFAKVLGERFTPFLMSALYPVLEKLGDETAYISSTAYLTLCDICHACKYRSVEELICHNADYLVNSISLRLRHFDMNRKSPLVLKVMLQYSSSGILPLIDDTVQEVLASLDDNYADQSVLFMSVLNELVRAVVRWYPPRKKSEVETSEIHTRGTKVKSTQEFVAAISEYYKLKKVSAGNVNCDDLIDDGKDISNDKDSGVEDKSDEYAEEDDIGQEEKNLPKHVLAVKEVMLRSKHLLSSSNPRLRLMVLDTLGSACVALQNYQNELLPLVHENWSAFAHRFVDDEKLVTRKALEILSIMADCTGDFLRSRTTKDVFPKILSFVQKQCEISVNSSKAYLYTVNYKLQHSILKSVGHICKKLEVQGTELDKVASVCLMYLSVRQPSPLQLAAMETCKVLIDLDADLIWLRLCNLYCPRPMTPPFSCYRKIEFQCVSGVKNEFTENVNKLLDPLTFTFIKK